MEIENKNYKAHCSFILLAGGKGKRMGSEIPKQFLEVNNKPLIYYSLKAIQASPIVDDCIIVTSSDDADYNIDYIKKNILNLYDFTKVKGIALGGRERFESVANGLDYLKKIYKGDIDHIVMIHDAARPLLSDAIIERCFNATIENGACVAAVLSKDTVTIADDEGFEKETPTRSKVWNVQTPQSFIAGIIYNAFDKLREELKQTNGLEKLAWITDDACVASHYCNTKIKIVEGDYKNIKVTTREDLSIIEEFLG